MTKALFDSQVVPKCCYCTYGTPASAGQNVLCLKKGVVANDYFCRRFQYDPLKRRPQKPIRQTFQQEDFTI